MKGRCKQRGIYHLRFNIDPTYNSFKITGKAKYIEKFTKDGKYNLYRFDDNVKIEPLEKSVLGNQEASFVSDYSLTQNEINIFPKDGVNWSRYESNIASQSCPNPVENGLNYTTESKNEKKEFDFDLHTYVIRNNPNSQSDKKHFENIDKFLNKGLVDVFTVGQAFPFSCSGFYITKVKDLDFKIKNVDSSRAMLTKQSNGFRLDVFGKKGDQYFYLNSVNLTPDLISKYYQLCTIDNGVNYDCLDKYIFTDENIKIAEEKAKRIITSFETNYYY